jgi:beta-glucanase (GH16 family)
VHRPASPRIVVESASAPVELAVTPAVYEAPIAPVARRLSAQARRDRSSASGRAMPLGSIPGWTQILADDFQGTVLPTSWGTYDGQPGNNPGGRWSSRQVTVHNGVLALNGSWQNGCYTTGGLMSMASQTTYGKFAVRFRIPRALGVKYALLLWPTGTWPAAGEIDFAEDGDGARQGIASTVHYGWENSQVQRNRAADFTHWQTVGVEWTPEKVVYTLNGKPWATVTGDSVPTGPMTLAMQVEAGTGDRWSHLPDDRTPAHTALEVDWAVGYRPA